MGLGQTIRSFDKYGASVPLNYLGEPRFTTTCGGLLSIATSVLVLFFFVKQLVDLINFEDPQLSTYTIRESRADMAQAFDMAFLRLKIAALAGFLSTSAHPGRSSEARARFVLSRLALFGGQNTRWQLAALPVSHQQLSCRFGPRAPGTGACCEVASTRVRRDTSRR